MVLSKLFKMHLGKCISCTGVLITVVLVALKINLFYVWLPCSQVLVCAPSNIAVDQLTEKIHKTGLKVQYSTKNPVIFK